MKSLKTVPIVNVFHNSLKKKSNTLVFDFGWKLYFEKMNLK